MVDLVWKHARLLQQIGRLGMFRRRLKRDPEARKYTDLALTPVRADEFDSYEMFSKSEAAKSEVEKLRHPNEPHPSRQPVLVNIAQ